MTCPNFEMIFCPRTDVRMRSYTRFEDGPKEKAAFMPSSGKNVYCMSPPPPPILEDTYDSHIVINKQYLFKHKKR
jgi:hypothetical protein